MHCHETFVAVLLWCVETQCCVCWLFRPCLSCQQHMQALAAFNRAGTPPPNTMALLLYIFPGLREHTNCPLSGKAAGPSVFTSVHSPAVVHAGFGSEVFPHVMQSQPMMAHQSNALRGLAEAATDGPSSNEGEQSCHPLYAACLTC